VTVQISKAPWLSLTVHVVSRPPPRAVFCSSQLFNCHCASTTISPSQKQLSYLVLNKRTDNNTANSPFNMHLSRQCSR